jgi:hypothetical protein
MSRFTTPEKSDSARERALAVAQWGGKVRVGRGADGKYHLAVVTEVPHRDVPRAVRSMIAWRSTASPRSAAERPPMQLGAGMRVPNC